MSHENVLPKAVQEQAAQADEIIKQVYAPEDPDKKPDKDLPADNPKPEETPTGEQPDEPANEPASEGEFEHKFKVLQGKYNKEVPRLHKQLRDSQQTNSRLNDRVSSLESEVKRLNEAPAPKKENPLSQDEIDQFGPDLIDIIRRVAKSETGVVLDEQLRPVRETMKQVKEKVAPEDKDDVESTRKQMLVDLGKEVPDWETQNEDPKFLKWLDGEDPITGRVRMAELADAYRTFDAETMIELFKGFQKENAVVNPEDEPSDETPEEDPAPKQDPEQPLEDLVAPGTPKTGSAGAQNESGNKKVWTQKEIREFYAYKNEFIKKNPEKELPEKVILQERDIFDAQHDGRIKP